jgi:PAS domain S-box-containing protein
LTTNSSTVPSGGFTLATIAVEAEHDLALLRRRAREIGEQSGMDPRGVRSLSTAAYEITRLLHGRAGHVRADVRLIEGPSLEIVMQALMSPVTDTGEPLALRVQPLQALVDGLTINETRESITVSIVVAYSASDWPDCIVAQPNEPVLELASAGLPGSSSDGIVTLQRVLQSELLETNRGVVALYHELSDQAERVRQAEDRFRLLLDSVQDYAICMLDLTGEVTSWNAGGERVFECAADDIIGRNFSSFYPAADRDAGKPEDHLSMALELGRLECEGVRVRRGGAAFDALVLLTPVRRADSVRGFALVVRDITERKRLEDDLRRRAEDLAAANRAKEDFLATLSHELRTPLNAMMGWTRLLRMGKLQGTAMVHALDTIERNAHIQEQLISDILDVSRIVTGRLRIALRPIGLAPVIDASLDGVRPSADAKGVQLSCDVRFAGTVMGDPDRLQQVVWNLLVNAIKFTQPGGKVTVSVVRAGPNAVITVVDTGEGIPDTLLPFVFDRFTQGDASSTRPHGGLGLGLSIVRHIVELHGGQVHATSEGLGLGSTFAVCLPVRAVQHISAPEPVDPALTGLKVLVVDDDPDAREVVSTALAQCGASTVAAGSTREALQILQEFLPDVLVSDISMPGEDGYALIRRVRALGPHGVGNVPAVALTGFTQTEDRNRALTAGFQQFIPKPVEADELAAVIRTLADSRVR